MRVASRVAFNHEQYNGSLPTLILRLQSQTKSGKCYLVISKPRTNFWELSPHALTPMHGRVNVWPKQMLCGYLKSREANIVEVIEGGAKSLFDIIAYAYSDVDHRVWIAIIKCEAPCGSSSPTTQFTKGSITLLM
ncbi:uncharacterized protein LOC114399256 [Glycine soja]|uniref:uncharacterized protein LOC114399256 n=1 Tax=Glycine soja TaxID=3848 RepID=UPI00103B2467|nr:uncharacterized protein LOC114399256 [Glycine soja]